jgi:hypothetical protein
MQHCCSHWVVSLYSKPRTIVSTLSAFQRSFEDHFTTAFVLQVLCRPLKQGFVVHYTEYHFAQCTKRDATGAVRFQTSNGLGFVAYTLVLLLGALLNRPFDHIFITIKEGRWMTVPCHYLRVYAVKPRGDLP